MSETYVTDPQEEDDRLRDTIEREEAFRQKLRDMRSSHSIPGYIGPRAGRDKT